MISVKVPGSKSITNRALILAAAAKTTSYLIDGLESDDTIVMKKALTQLGVKIKKHKNVLTIVPPRRYKQVTKPIYCGNSGTTIRFLTALLATQTNEYILNGDERMRERPIQDLGDALIQLGVEVTYLRKNGFVPIKIKGPFTNNECTVKGIVSSQYLSALLMAAASSTKKVKINISGPLVSKPYVDITRALIKEFDKKITIEGDASAATYFWGIGELTGVEISITNVPTETLQPDYMIKDLLRKIRQNEGGSMSIDATHFPDGAMTAIVFSAFIKGKWTFTGLHNLRVKESDRLYALTTELRRIGATVQEKKDGIVVTGNPEKLHKANIRTYNDHRIAMCFGMAQVVIPGIKIMDPGCVRKTYPNFWKDIAKVKKMLQKKNIVLIGMRGCGKTKLGKELSKQLDRDFIDTDIEIEKRIKMSVNNFVERKGWDAFRKVERLVVERVSKLHGTVISTGGGVPIAPLNSSALKKNGHILYLHCSEETLRKRLALSKHRPSLTTAKNPADEVGEVLKKRLPVYRSTADSELDVSSQSNQIKRDIKRKTADIMKIVRRWGIL